MMRKLRFFYITTLVCLAGWAAILLLTEGTAGFSDALGIPLAIGVIMQVFAWAGRLQKDLQGPAAEQREGSGPQDKNPPISANNTTSV